jgi:hypothetical protein
LTCLLPMRSLSRRAVRRFMWRFAGASTAASLGMFTIRFEGNRCSKLLILATVRVHSIGLALLPSSDFFTVVSRTAIAFLGLRIKFPHCVTTHIRSQGRFHFTLSIMHISHANMSGTTRALAVKSNTLVPLGIAYAINGLYSCRSQEGGVAQG